MTRVLHISDTHFGTERPAVVRALLALAQRLSPDLVVLSGDITQRARSREFALARRFVADLGFPTLSIPGNHDIPLWNVAARLLNPYGGYRRALGPTLEPVFSNDGVVAIGVNTTRPSRHKNGSVSADQIARVCERLRQSGPRQLRIVVVHQPVRALVESDTANLLAGRERAVPAWIDAGADLVLGGHIHLPYVVPLTASSATRHGWAVQAGTAVSRRVRGSTPNSVNVIEHEAEEAGNQCAVQRWDYSGTEESFVCVDGRKLPLAR